MKAPGLVLPVLMVGALYGAGPAVAAPEEPGCATTVSAPRVIDVSGTAMVSASASPGVCNRAEPQLQVVCLQRVGSPLAPMCEEAGGPATARVILAPYVPGASYVATGRSCANSGSPAVAFCRAAGPVTVTL